MLSSEVLLKSTHTQGLFWGVGGIINLLMLKIVSESIFCLHCIDRVKAEVQFSYLARGVWDQRNGFTDPDYHLSD